MSRIPARQFEEVVRENKAAIFRICKAYLGASEDANDLYQEVLINIWKSLSRFKGESKISTWIYRVTVNTAITYNRKLQRHQARSVPMDNLTHFGSDESEKMEKTQLENDLNRMMELIKSLDKDQRIVIGLYLEDLSYKEIAEVIGKDTNYVGVRIKRIKEKLSKLMSHERAG